MLKKLLQFVTTLPEHLPLRVTLVGPFVLLIVIVVSLTGYQAYRNGQYTVNDLATQIGSVIAARIEQHVSHYMALPYHFLLADEGAANSGQLPLEDAALLKRYFWQQTQNSPNITYIYYGSDLGHFTGISRLNDDEVLLYTRDDSTAPFRESWLLDPKTGERKALVKKTTYDPRERPWYQKATRAAQPVWSDIYQFASQPVLGITATVPVYDLLLQLRGVLAIDIQLAHISKFLRSLDLNINGQAFIMERNGDIIASSAQESPFIIDAKKQQQRLQAIDSQQPLISAAARYLQLRLDEEKMFHSTQWLSFMLDGEKILVKLLPFQDSYGLDWLIAIVMPEADFMSEVNANTPLTLILIGLVLAISLIVGFLMASWVIRPVTRLNKAAQQISAGGWGETVTLQRGDEIGELGESFNVMSLKLKEAFSVLEEVHESLEDRVAERTQALSDAYRRLKTSQSQLIQSEKMASLGQMVAGVSHEINTPLGYVKGNVNMFSEQFREMETLVNECTMLVTLLTSEDTTEDILDDQIKRVGEMIREWQKNGNFADLHPLYADTLHGIEQISRLVTNLKNFSRLDQAYVDNINLNESLDSVLNIAQNFLRQKAKIHKAYGELPRISCSPSQINQVFLNLLTNAAQAIEKKGIIALKTEADEQFVHISIRDNGKGMDSDVMKRVFDPFFTTRPVGEGTGLGLSISYQIVRQHGGQIRIASRPGKGTRFVVSLPRRQPDKQDESENFIDKA